MTLEVLISAALRILVLGAALWLFLRLFRVRNPHVEKLAWRMVLIVSLATPLLLVSGLAPSVATSLDLPVVLAGASAPGDAVAASGHAGASGSWLGVAALSIYLAVAAALLARLAAGLVSMWRVCAAARPESGRDEARISATLRSPATFGAVILLPEASGQWSADTRAAVLAHERAHVRSHDGYWSWLAQFHAAIFWFNPLAWWLRRRLEALAETTSDDAVVAARHDPVVYAALLLDFARQPNYRSVVMSVAESNVPDRIERILARIPPGAELSRFTRWLALAALVPIALLAASTTRVLAQSPAEAQSKTATVGNAVRLVRASDPDDFYPAAAKQAKVAASVTLSVDVDPSGQVVDVKVLSPLPSDDPFGFGPAAVEVARRSQYSNPFPETANLKFKVKFALASDLPPPGTARSAALRGGVDPDQFYPPGAKSRREQGSPVVKACVGPDGNLLRDPVVTETSNYPEIDQAAVEVAKRTRYSAAVDSGKALAESCIRFKVKFVLAEDPPAPAKT